MREKNKFRRLFVFLFLRIFSPLPSLLPFAFEIFKMNRITMAGLIATVAIAAAVIFTGCVEEETSVSTPTPVAAPSPTPQLSTPEPSDESVLYVREVSMECRIMDEYTTVYYSIGSNHNKVVEAEVKICIGDNICKL